jgi:hypothetical protein
MRSFVPATMASPGSLGGSVNQVGSEVEIMLAAGLEDEEIIRLARFKLRVDQGQCDDLTIEYKRFMFLKYLYESGIILN